MIPAVFGRRTPCFCAERRGKAAGAAETCECGDGGNGQLCGLHKMDASGNPVIIQIL